MSIMVSKKLISRKFPPYLPFDSGRFRLSMGLVSLNLVDWLEPDELFHEELLEKENLLHSIFNEVFQARAGSQLAQQEVLELLIDHMTKVYPELLQEEVSKITIKQTGRMFLKKGFCEAPLNLAGRIVQEDLCLMAPGPNGYTLEAASLCFPSRWRLLEKIGKPMIDIHSPVPGYKDKLVRPVDRFLDRLVIEKPVWRVNWSLTDDARLYQPIRNTEIEPKQSINIQNVGEEIFLRCERQTLRRLPNSGWILFTIKTYLDKISKLSIKPGAARDLASLVRDLPDDMLLYKNIAPYQKSLLYYLDQITAEQ